eukprot:TRINITY_DN59437_c0_g1_i2.p2 TRINITY_DN59437_c0_g1~~TRINITY_DN59437_c0_g1_i2.p2  ORF type:complete len:123 (-),score=16.72 TRINITY_DN59437_c0_g1_i2:321-689(-)
MVHGFTASWILAVGACWAINSTSALSRDDGRLSAGASASGGKASIVVEGASGLHFAMKRATAQPQEGVAGQIPERSGIGAARKGPAHAQTSEVAASGKAAAATVMRKTRQASQPEACRGKNG